MKKTITKLLGLTTLITFVLTSSVYAKEAITPGFNTKIPESIMTPDKVKTSIGDLSFFDGLPDDETITKVYDNLDKMRAVEVFLNFIPATSLEGILHGLGKFGAKKYNQIALFDKLMDSNPLFLTGNTDTVYSFSFIDLSHGPLVVEIPKGSGPGTIDDAFFRFVVDMGAPGPDNKKGGTYLILPPDYKGDLKSTPNTIKQNQTVKVKIGKEIRDVWVAQSRTFNNWMALRGFLVDGKPDVAAKMFKEGLKVYTLAEANNPPEMEFVSVSKKIGNTIHANDIEFYEELNRVIQREPVEFIEPQLRGLAASIGIIKGQKFAPDARMKKILVDAVAIGNATARAIWLQPRDKSAYFFDDRQWYTGFVGGDYKWLNSDGKSGRNLDARTLFFYMATVNTPAMVLEIPGVGSNYAIAVKDKDNNYLDGSKNYKLNIPANVPAKDFWSLVIYDPQTRSELQTDQPFPSKNNKKSGMKINKDGSVDIYFGPKPPKGKKGNWIQTVPGKGWFILLRLYGPLEPWFERTWKPGDIELVK